MSYRFLRRALLALTALAPLALPSAAQEATTEAAGVVIPEDSVQIVLARFQTLQQQMGSLQEEVLNTTPALQTAQAEVAELVEAAVTALDPTLQTEIEARMPALQQEAQAAQAAGDTARLEALEAEYVALRTRAETAETAALEQPEIQTRVDAFQEALRAEMEARDPQVEVALAELEALATRLDATLGGG